MTESDDELWARWSPHWRETARTFAGFVGEHRDDVWCARAPAAVDALRAAIAALMTPAKTPEAAVGALLNSGVQLAWLVCDSFYSREEFPGDLDDWLLEPVEDFESEPVIGADPAGEISAVRASLEALNPLAARYDLSKSRGRAMRPVAPGIGGRLLHEATEELLAVALAVAKLTFDRRR